MVAVYETHSQGAEAVRELHKAGFDMKRLSTAGKGCQTEEQHVAGFYHAGGRMKYWGRTGSFWGGLWRLLDGAGFFAVPGVGPLLLAGPLVACVVDTLEKAPGIGSPTDIGAALHSLGLPKESVIRYEAALHEDKFLLIAHGTAQEVMRAKDGMRMTRPEEVNVHFTDVAVLRAG
jgi:hypothetical protein